MILNPLLRNLLLPRRLLLTRHAITHQRPLTSSSASWVKKMPDRPKPINEEEFTESFLCGTGPGGQKINKTASAVQLKHLATGLVLKVQATRSRSQNRKIARQMLAERVDEIVRGKESRAAVVREVKIKRKSSAVKKSKRKYRALEEEAKAAAVEGGVVPRKEEEVEEEEGGFKGGNPPS